MISLLRNGEILKSKQKLILEMIKEKSFNENSSRLGVIIFRSFPRNHFVFFSETCIKKSL
ncbi:hypothetical protein NTGZN8_50030 [Candidatus Nitrotoga fabula]|uniref:Uncharacterized protein n=1 Tax=Candidatus Nitrotoga fabula TaxID=2182327 RepID=A0A916F9H7_9PROT|nr:hypothetical protein NTGZN8_50030 [Candidatus Nitrotoga fabula]